MIRRASVTYFFFTLVYLLALMLCKMTDASMENVQIANIVVASMIAASFYLIWLFASTRKHPNLSKCITIIVLIVLFVVIYMVQPQKQKTDGVFFIHPSYWVGFFVTIVICWVCEYQVQEYQEEKREEEIRGELGKDKEKSN